jgi:ankyrin repeat protein
MTALMIASSIGHFDIVKHLVIHRADVNAKYEVWMLDKIVWKLTYFNRII